MSSKYICKDCNIDFKQKSHYENHKKKKIPCILKDKLEEIINDAVDTIKKEQIESEESTKLKQADYSYLRLPNNTINFEYKQDNSKDNKLHSVLRIIDKAHNILYQAESIVGQKALSVIMSFLFIKLIQPYLSVNKEVGKIDLLNKTYYSERFDDETLDKILGYFKDLKTLTKQSSKEIRDDSNIDAIKQMGEILKRHPITKMIYTEANFVKVREASTIQTLLNTLDEIKFKDFEENEDVIGEIYEHMLNKYVKTDSKELGQFFTPRKLMKIILEYKKDNIIDLFKKLKGNISICDPCMGTGGWLVSSFNEFNKQFKNRINIAGGEVEPETFQYGIMNIILTQHKFPDDIKCNSSLTCVNKNKHNLITTNPPFNSNKQIKFDKLKENFTNDKITQDNKLNIADIYTLQKDDPPIQFLELDLYKLEENGMCIIVLPYGEFFSGKPFAQTRKHFMKNINITDIIIVPNIFTHTDIKTCVLIFEKNKSGTKNIKFSKINEECTEITTITSAKIDDINKEPLNSWYHTDYLHDRLIYDLSLRMPQYDWIPCIDIFTLVKGKIESNKVDEDENGITFVTGAKDESFKKIVKQKESYLNGENVFISPNGNGNKRPVKYFNGECNFSNLLAVLNIKKEYINKINKKYLYYFLKYLQEHIENNYQKGSCNQSLDIKNFNRLKLLIPDIDIQNKIIAKLDSSQLKIKYLRLLADNIKKDIQTNIDFMDEIDEILLNSNNKILEYLEMECNNSTHLKKKKKDVSI